MRELGPADDVKAPQPRGKTARESNEDQRKQENLGFRSGVAQGGSKMQRKQGRFDGNGADEHPPS